jgi:hypothetical protein
MTSTIIGQVVTRDGMARQSYLHAPPARPVGPFALAYERPPLERL